MSHHIKVSRFFTIPVHELFGYFIDPKLLKQWCYPEGMSLKTIHFDARVGGKYQFEHATPKETFKCHGHVHKFVLNEHLRMVDDEFFDKDGKRLEMGHPTCDIRFTAFGSGSGIEITIAGFAKEKDALDCEQGWKECLNHLQELVKDSGIRQFNEGRFDQGLVQT